MTPEQFVYWMSGYFSGGRDNDVDAIVEDIKQALNKVKISPIGLFVIGGLSE